MHNNSSLMPKCKVIQLCIKKVEEIYYTTISTGCSDGPSISGTTLPNNIFSCEVTYGHFVVAPGQEEASAWNRGEERSVVLEGAASTSYQPSRTEIAVDYFLKKLANKEISQR